MFRCAQLLEIGRNGRFAQLRADLVIKAVAECVRIRPEAVMALRRKLNRALSE